MSLGNSLSCFGGEDPRFSVGEYRQVGVKPLALAFGVFITTCLYKSQSSPDSFSNPA